MERWERVLHLHRLISLQRYPNASLAARELAVADRTIRRDIEWMKDAFQAPISYNPQRRGYFYSEPAFTLPASVLSRSQLVGLMLSAQALERDTLAPWHESAASAYRQIQIGMPSSESGQQTWINRVRFERAPAWKLDRKLWNTLCLCLECQERARVTLIQPAQAMLFDPYGLYIQNDNVAVIGKDCATGELRSLALNEIRQIEYAGANFKLERGFNMDEAIARLKQAGMPAMQVA